MPPSRYTNIVDEVSQSPSTNILDTETLSKNPSSLATNILETNEGFQIFFFLNMPQSGALNEKKDKEE